MDEILGMIKLFGGNFAPKGWFECKGQTLAINGNEALFSILGTQYGGDGRTTFCLPNLVDKCPTDTVKELRYIICYQGIYPERP
jgi:microcystin-dependent protein